MRGLTTYARDDYNLQLNVLKGLAKSMSIETSLTVIECGSDRIRSLIFVERQREMIDWIPECHDYRANGGGTPLFDSVGQAIEILEKVVVNPEEDASFLVVAITDGQNNQISWWTASRLSKKIAELQATDKWTFTFRVPHGYKNALTKLGIYDDNILEWEQTQAGVEKASQQTVQAYQSYYTSRSAGQTSTSKFFTNLEHVSSAEVHAKLNDISREVQILTVQNGHEGAAIKTFVETRTGRGYVAGSAFYQLIKGEKVQDSKEIIIQDRTKNTVYSGWEARNLLGLPRHGEVKVHPGKHGNYDIFVQSRSVNRILPVGSKVILWRA